MADDKDLERIPAAEGQEPQGNDGWVRKIVRELRERVHHAASAVGPASGPLAEGAKLLDGFVNGPPPAVNTDQLERLVASQARLDVLMDVVGALAGSEPSLLPAQGRVLSFAAKWLDAAHGAANDALGPAQGEWRSILLAWQGSIMSANKMAAAIAAGEPLGSDSPSFDVLTHGFGKIHAEFGKLVTFCRGSR